jgi:hypothetical protein
VLLSLLLNHIKLILIDKLREWITALGVKKKAKKFHCLKISIVSAIFIFLSLVHPSLDPLIKFLADIHFSFHNSLKNENNLVVINNRWRGIIVFCPRILFP